MSSLQSFQWYLEAGGFFEAIRSTSSPFQSPHSGQQISGPSLIKCPTPPPWSEDAIVGTGIKVGQKEEHGGCTLRFSLQRGKREGNKRRSVWERFLESLNASSGLCFWDPQTTLALLALVPKLRKMVHSWWVGIQFSPVQLSEPFTGQELRIPTGKSTWKVFLLPCSSITWKSCFAVFTGMEFILCLHFK